MKNKECYLKFIRGEKCSLEEFRIAYYYRNSVRSNKQMDFEMLMNSIMDQCFDKMMETKRIDNDVVKDIYEYHGLNDRYFGIFFQLYLQTFPSASQEYEKLKQELKWNFYEKIYNEIKTAFFSKESELLAAETYHMSYYKIRSILKLVASKNFGLTEGAFQEMINTYKFFNLFNQTLKFIYFEKAFLYYKLYASIEEKCIFQQKVNDFLKSLNFEKLSAIPVHQLYDLLQLVPMEENLQLNIYFTFKYYYDFCVAVSWNSSKIKEEATLKGIKYSQFILYAKEYATKYLHIPNIDDIIYYHRFIKKQVQSKYNAFIEQILRESDPTIIDELFAKIPEKRSSIIKYCYAKNRPFTEQERREKESILLSNFDAYKLRCKQSKDTDSKRSYVDIFQQYINSSLDLEQYCQSISITSNCFKSRLRGLNDPILLNKVKEKLFLESERKRQEKVLLMKQIIFLIRNGIPSSDENRPFDLLDFFYYYPNVNYKSLKTAYKEITKEDLTVYNKFFSPLSVFPTYFNPKTIIHSHYELNSKKDLNGQLIPGSGLVLSQEDLTQIVDFFEKNKIPKLTILLDIAIKRYLTHTLFVPEHLQNLHLSLK